MRGNLTQRSHEIVVAIVPVEVLMPEVEVLGDRKVVEEQVTVIRQCSILIRLVPVRQPTAVEVEQVIFTEHLRTVPALPDV